MNVNSWGTVTETNYDYMIENTQKYGPLRVSMAIDITPILNKSGLSWYLDTGNLMGAYRYGKMLKHDDDFDIGLYASECDLNELFKLLQNEMDGKYKIRFIDTYCKKLEIYNESHGSYVLDADKGYNYHNVTIDIQLYVPKDDGSVDYKYTKNRLNEFIHIKHDMILPLGTINYEGYSFKSPNNVKEYLIAHYGYIGPNAVFNNVTRKYQLKS